MTATRKRRKPVANRVTFASSDFVKVADFDIFTAGMSHERVTLAVIDQPRRLQVAFEALEKVCTGMAELRVIRGDVGSRLETPPADEVPQRQYDYRVVLTRLDVQRSLLRCAWTALYEALKQAREHVEKFNVTSFKTLFQHNIMAAEALLLEATELSNSACTTRRGDSDSCLAIQQQYELYRAEIAKRK